MQYEHTQQGTVIKIILGLTSALCIVIGIFSSNQEWLTLVLLFGFPVVLIIVGWLFGSLTIEVDQEELRHYFGSGVWKKTYPLCEIESAKPVRNSWLYGWGIRMTLHGWLYNVSGLDAMQVQLRSGRTFRIGTDDPTGGTKAITDAITHT